MAVSGSISELIEELQRWNDTAPGQKIGPVEVWLRPLGGGNNLRQRITYVTIGSRDIGPCLVLFTEELIHEEPTMYNPPPEVNEP
jgi:hypothetical protein